MNEVDLKNYIQLKLQTLIPASLATVVCDDFKTDFLSREVNAFPTAIITPASVDSQATDSNDNVRTYIFDILVVQKGENIQSATDIETLRQTIMDLFDKDLTFSGYATAGVAPSSSKIGAFSHSDQ